MTDDQAWAAVQGFLAQALDRRPAGPIRLLSLSAGAVADLVRVVRDHPRGEDVRGVLVEADPILAGRAGQAITGAGLEGQLSVLCGDAGTTDTYAIAVPADILLLGSIFSAISDDDVDYTVRSLSRLCDEDATVLWARSTTSPDLTVWIRQWFAESGFLELGFVEVGFDAAEEADLGVGFHRLIAEPDAFASGLRLFRFVDR